jgi:hypothetical protein
MNDSQVDSSQSVVEHYWTVLPKYNAALQSAVALSHRIGGRPVNSHREYWASTLLVRLCSVATSILHLCPGSPANTAGEHWDFSSLAPLVRSLIQTALTLFNLGTETVDDGESRARVLTMQLRGCAERQNLFQSFGATAEKILEFQAQADYLRAELSSNPYFSSLPAHLQEAVMNGERASILTEDQILGRMGVLDQNDRAFLGFISSHADVSPLAYDRTGESNRGRGEENDTDKHYIATAIGLACDFVARSDADVRALFREVLSAKPQKPATDVGDERFRHALNYVLQWQGAHVEEFAVGDGPEGPLLCSDCFHDEGMRLSAMAIGQRDMSKCPNCGSQFGMKLSGRSIAVLTQQFFVSGTIHRGKYGATPVVQFNKHQSTSIDMPPWLEADVRLIERTIQVGFFHYSPRLWTAGQIEPLKALQEESSRGEVISRILDKYPGRILGSDERFYRLRIAPTRPGDFDQYDPPPDGKLGQGRFDTPEFPILYGSQDLEVCVHECRIAAEDEMYIATLVPQRRLKLLNLAEPLWEENVTEFESLDLALHMLFLGGSHSYEISRQIARAAQKHGFDGLVYPSYFTLLRTGGTPFETWYGISTRRFSEMRERLRKSTISNVALFGRPIADGSVRVQCINKVILRRVEYNLHFGPLLPRDFGPDYDGPIRRLARAFMTESGNADQH